MKVKWEQAEDELRDLAKSSTSGSDMLRKLGLVTKGGNLATLKKWCQYYGITIPKYERAPPKNEPSPYNVVMVENSSYPTSKLKKRLIRDGLIEEKCALCGLGNRWNDKDLVLQLDHINGINNDHRKENLRLLCPNCHSQTPTFSGRSWRRVKPTCIACGDEISSSKHQHCKRCSQKGKNTKITWPPMEDLLNMLNESNFAQVARELGVSDNAIRKRIRNHLEVI